MVRSIALKYRAGKDALYLSLTNVTTHTDFNGQVTTMTYDVMDRLLRKDFFDGTFEAWTYTDNGLVATSEVSRGVTTNTYDNRDRLVRVDEPDGAYLEYTYDDQGNRLSVTTPAGTTSYTFDVLNRLETTTDASLNTTTYSYDAVGNRAGMVYAMGNSTTYTYDTLNRLTRLEHKDASDQTQGVFVYTLGPAGNRLKIQDQTGRVFDYTYDTTYKLLTESITGDLGTVSLDVTYTYDQVGNRLTKSVAGTTTAVYTYDDNDRIVSEVDPVASTTTTYTYDDNGNTTQKDEAGVLTAYAYDAENQLNTLTNNEGGASESTATYVYDDQGMRVGKTEAGAQITYLLDKNRAYAQVLSEYDSNDSTTFNTTGAATVSYTYGDDLISQERGSVNSTYLYDGLGSTRLLIDQAGAVTDSYLYEAFGELIDSTGSTVNDYLYTGEQFDANAGFYYLRARYYNQEVGRFSNMDVFPGEVSIPISLNKYLYTHANPVIFVDPRGLYTQRFGYLVEKEVEGQYERSFGGPPGVTFGRLEFGLKPDIFDRNLMRFMEIKPLSPGGIGSGFIQIKLYQQVYGRLGMKVGRWTPSPAIVDGQVVGFKNVKGIIFYTDDKRVKLEAAGAVTAAALRQALRKASNPKSKIVHTAVTAITRFGGVAARGIASSQIGTIVGQTSLAGAISRF